MNTTGNGWGRERGLRKDKVKRRSSWGEKVKIIIGNVCDCYDGDGDDEMMKTTEKKYLEEIEVR
jgi:hypothetical protein